MECSGKKVEWVEHAIASKNLDHARTTKVVNEMERVKEFIALHGGVSQGLFGRGVLISSEILLLGFAKSMRVDAMEVEDDECFAHSMGFPVKQEASSQTRHCQ